MKVEIEYLYYNQNSQVSFDARKLTISRALQFSDTWSWTAERKGLFDHGHGYVAPLTHTRLRKFAYS